VAAEAVAGEMKRAAAGDEMFLIAPASIPGSALFLIRLEFEDGLEGYVAAIRASPERHLRADAFFKLVPSAPASLANEIPVEIHGDTIRVRRPLQTGNVDLVEEIPAAALARERMAIMAIVSVGVLCGLTLAFVLIFVLGRRLILLPIAALRKSQLQLVKSEEEARRLTVALEETEDHVLISDATGHLTWVNSAACKITGLTREEMIGRRPSDFLFGPKTPAATRQLVLEARRDRKSVKFRSINYTKSGETYVADVSLTPVIHRDLDEVTYVAIERNVTDTYEAEERLQAAVDAMTDGFAVVGQDGHFRIFNAAYGARIRELGFEMESGTSYADMIDGLANAGICSFNGLGRDEWIAENLSTFEAGVSREFLAVDRSGKSFLRRHRKLPSGDTVMIATDVSEITEARGRAEAAVEAKSRFTASISHELRTPLNGVISISDLLLARPLDGEVHEYVRLIRDSGLALFEILNDILDISKLQAGRMTLRPEPIDLAGIVDDCCRLLTPLAEAKGLRLNLSGEPEMAARVSGDRGRIRQIVTNLLGNAIKFTEAGEITVHLSGRRDGPVSNISISVADTGEGIGPEDMNTIFSPFEQSQALRANKAQEGTGLGLSICMELAQLMGGSLAATSEMGKGSTFVVSLPLKIVDDGGQTRDAPRRLTSGINGRASTVGGSNCEARLTSSKDDLPLVMAVEDNATNRFVLQAMLEDQPCRLILCKTGAEALAVIVEETPDVILMDVHLPDMSGAAVTAEILSTLKPSGRSLPAIFAYTAGLTDAEEGECLASGMLGTIRKPVRKDKLIDMLGHWLMVPKGADRSVKQDHVVQGPI
jgi:PAS domain S-box-containing protein